jgi:GT2 family glycosyltransferase
MDLSIAIVSWNTKRLLDECLESTYRTTKGIEFEVIVVDSVSSDDSAQMVR